MVAVVTGNNLGLVAGSAGVLGSNGQLGSAATGRGGDAAFVNATTGNLTIQRQDELLIGVGPDIGIVRTYNSKGTFDFDNNDNWQISLYRRVFGVTGTVNTAGSTIKRTGADGAELIHTYDTTLAKYVNKDGSGSFNTLTYNAGTNAWTWVNGDSRTTEAYELQTTGTYRIKTLADSDGNILTYSYDAATSLITQVADANGEKTQLIYNTTTKQLSQINVVNSSNVTTTRVRYTYDTNTPIARLISVSTDLTPVDGSIADGNAYVTTYAYVGTTNLVSSITNSDGTKTSFTYDASNRVATVTDGTGYITNFAYPSSTTATITDAASQVTTLTYSAVADGSIGQLTGIQDPSGSGQNILYAYDTSGNVTQMTDSRGNVTKYTYDTNGNQTRQEDALGNTITRTFSATNQLLSETVYATPDTVPGDTTYNAALPQTTRYVYDDSVGGTNNRLRFMISPEGRVTEYQYNAVGQRIVSIQYAGLTSIATNLYTTAGTPTEAQMTSWAGATDKTKSQRSDYGYDVRGQLSTRSTYTTVNAAGAGVVDATTATTQYVYDQNGNLVQAIDARGVATTAITTDFITSYSYDGLNRLVSQTDALGNVTTSVFDDTSNRQVKVTLANGLVTTSSYDAAGRLLSVSNGQAATPTALGTISYLYNNLGQLRQIIDPTGQKTYYIYDSLGRKVGAIDPQLALTEYVYNNNNQVVRIIQYTNAVTATLNATTALTITLASTRPVLAATTDRLDRNLYDKVGRLAKQVSAVGAVTEYQYDGASRLVTTIGYANLLSVAQLNALAALSTEPLATDANTIPVADATNDRRARQFYSDDGLLAATLDGEGYLTEYTYNAAGQRTSSIRYGTITPSAQWVSGALSALRPALDVNNDQTSYNIYNARGQLEGSVDALGYLTEYQYDTVGNRTLTTRYATSITYTVGVSVAASRPADALTNSENQSSTTTYDANNRVTSNTSAPDGLITNYSYDTVGNLTQKVNTFSGATALDNRSQFKQYDQLGRVTRELSGEGVLALQALVSPTQVQIDAVWDSYGNRYTYDLAGRVMAATTANGANTTGNKSLYYYDNEGKLKYQVNALGEVTQYNYNNFDNTTTTRRYNTRIVATTLATMTGGFATAVDATITALVAGGYSDTLAAYSNLGQTTTLTDALANANSRSYNAFGERKDTTNKIDASTTNITSYVYDRRGMVKTTTEDSAAINRITQAVYDAFGRITQTTDGRGGIVKRSYDKLGREVSVWDANSNAASLTTNNSFTTYDAFSRVLTRRDGRGVAGGYNTVSYSYNSTARSMTMTTAEGVSMITTKNRFGETVQITDGRNNVTTYTYNTDGQLKSTTTPTGTVATPTTSTNTTTYDAAGHVTTTTDARGINTTFSYDAANRVLSRTVDPTSLNPTGLNLITQYSYDALGRQTWVKDAKGVWTRTDYDAKGQVTSMVVDPSTIPVIDAVTGLVTTTTANATGLNITTNFTYDARGKRLTVVEAAGSSQPKTTQYLYDKLGRLTQTAIDPAGLNLRTSYSYDKNDNVVLKTDANGNKTVYSYDANNRLIYTVDALGDVSKNDYDIDGNVLTTTKYATPLVAATLTTLLATPSTAIVPTVNAAADLVTRNVYDKDNRRSFGIDALGYVTKYEYDANRNVTKTTQYGNAMVGAATAGVAPRILATAGTGNYVVISANDQVTQMTYDAANRAITSTDALGITTSYTYDANGNQLSVTEGVGTASQRITRQEFDAMGRKTAAVDALGYRTETTYDALGNIVTVKDAKGAFGYFYYDAASRMTLQVNPEGSATETRYNALGNQTDIIRYATKFVGTLMVGTKPTITANVNLDQRQVVTYDAASRKLNIKTAFANTGGQTLDSTAGTGNAYIESFTYDAFGNVLTSIARNGASTTYSYDALNRKVTETLPINSKNASNVLTVVQNSFVYDTFGNLSTKTEAVGLPEQRMTTYVYDLLNRQTQEIGQTFTSFNPITQANVSVIPTRTKTYDARGNVTSETDANNNKTIYYYDSLDRRIGSVTTDGVYTKWTYDAVGNKIGQTIYANKVSNPTVGSIPAVTLDAPNDRTTIYRYDSVGRLTETEIQNITFGSVNAANQYIVSTGSIKTLTSYDALGNVVKVVDANNGLLAPTDPNYKATRI